MGHSPFVGRYAPSPTGSLHLGNLRTALAAYLSTRARGGRFLLRIEDLDVHRCRPEFEERQLADLTALGIEWDDPPIRQSDRGELYAHKLEQLADRRLAYPCFCSRKDVAEALSAPHGPDGNAYPGTCRAIPPAVAMERIAAGERHSWRIRIDSAPATFFDAFRGEVSIDLAREGGDFVIKRADGIHAYQIACAVDDALSNVTEVLRGGDLLDSGARQAHILASLSLPVPRYLHIPMLMGPDGRRLAKRIGSEDLSGFLSRGFDAIAVRSYLAFSLGQISAGARPTMEELIRRWDIARVPKQDAVFRESELEAFRGQPSG